MGQTANALTAAGSGLPGTPGIMGYARVLTHHACHQILLGADETSIQCGGSTNGCRREQPASQDLRSQARRPLHSQAHRPHHPQACQPQHCLTRRPVCPAVVVFCSAMGIISPVYSVEVVFCSAVGIFSPVCTAVGVISSAMGIFSPICSAMVTGWEWVSLQAHSQREALCGRDEGGSKVPIHTFLHHHNQNNAARQIDVLEITPLKLRAVELRAIRWLFSSRLNVHPEVSRSTCASDTNFQDHLPTEYSEQKNKPVGSTVAGGSETEVPVRFQKKLVIFLSAKRIKESSSMQTEDSECADEPQHVKYDRALKVFLKGEDDLMSQAGQYAAVAIHMENLAQTSQNADIAGGGKKVVKTMTDLQFVVFWNFLTDVLEKIATLSQTLQKADLILPSAVAAVESCLTGLDYMKTYLETFIIQSLEKQTPGAHTTTFQGIDLRGERDSLMDNL
ncbi:unnamed protein product [Leuciscus chuanchicus]